MDNEKIAASGASTKSMLLSNNNSAASISNQPITQMTTNAFWHRYLATLAVTDAPLTQPKAEQFGDGVAMGNELAVLIVRGVKTATCSCLWEWQDAGETPPRVGDISILLDGNERAVAVIEVTEVVVCAYEDVDAAFAFDEGEDDRSLASWRRIHWQWFKQMLPAIGREPAMTMPLVCERFQVRYREA
jgi:uncharacterized protein YhfF